MSHLYKLSAKYQQLLDQESYSEHDMIELEQLSHDIEEEAIQVASQIKNLETQLYGVENAINEMTDRRRGIMSKIEKLNHFLAERLSACKKDEVACPYFTVKLKTNRASVDDYNKHEIPEQYWVKKEVFSVDKLKIKSDIESGKQVPGARLINKKTVSIC